MVILKLNFGGTFLKMEHLVLLDILKHRRFGESGAEPRMDQNDSLTSYLFCVDQWYDEKSLSLLEKGEVGRPLIQAPFFALATNCYKLYSTRP